MYRLSEDRNNTTAVKEAIASTQKALRTIKDLFSGSPFSFWVISLLITIADFYLIPILFYLEQTPQFSQVAANTPKLQNWWQRTKIINK